MYIVQENNRESDKHKSDVAFSAIYEKAASMTEDPEIMHRRKCRQGTQDVRHCMTQFMITASLREHRGTKAWTACDSWSC